MQCFGGFENLTLYVNFYDHMKSNAEEKLVHRSIYPFHQKFFKNLRKAFKIVT